MNFEESDLSLLDSNVDQDDYLRNEYGPDIFVSRSKINMNLIKVFRPGGVHHSKPKQIAEGEFRMITYLDQFGRIVHEVDFLESTKFLESKKRSWWSKLCFWRKD